MSVEPQSEILPEGLKAAIACLDLSLESELALYRRHRSQESGALALLSSTEPEASALDTSRLDPSDLALETFSSRGDQSPQEATETQNLAEATDLSVALTAAEEDSDTLPEPYSAEITAQPQAFEQFLDPSIEDYLESSEALLKHLDEPTQPESSPDPAPNQPPQRSWFVILGITLIVLGVLALGGFFVVLAVRWFSKPSLRPAPQSLVSPNPEPNVSGSSTLPVGASPQSPQSLQSSSAGTPGAIAPSPSVKPTPSINPNASRYIVLAVSNSPGTLQEAQRLAPDAFITLWEGQKRIQMGSLDSLQQAQQMVNELKNQGFPASIVTQN